MYNREQGSTGFSICEIESFDSKATIWLVRGNLEHCDLCGEEVKPDEKGIRITTDCVMIFHLKHFSEDFREKVNEEGVEKSL